MLFRYLPFAADGLALTMLSISAEALAIRFCGRERDLADRRVHDAGLVDAELHLAGLDFLDRLGDVGGDGAGLRVRHQAARAEHLAELADGAHHVGRRDDGVEVHPAAGDLLDQLLAADTSAPASCGFPLLVGAGDDEHALGLAQPVRQHHRAADHLVGVLRIDAQANRQPDGLVELRELELLDAAAALLSSALTPLLRPAASCRGRISCRVLSLPWSSLWDAAINDART